MLRPGRLLNLDEYPAIARVVEPRNIWSHDHMEVFLAAPKGRVVGRVE